VAEASAPLVQDGILAIPLFHGTSSLFVDSIQARGLGAENPLRELGVLPLLRAMYSLIEKVCPQDEEWLLRRVVVEPMLRQEVTAGGFNFQHGASYLTPSRSSAVGYALSNRFGSELVTQAFYLYEKLQSVDATLLAVPEISESPAVQCFSLNTQPYLVTAHHVPLTHLDAEDGTSAEAMIEQLALFRDLLDRTDATVNLNFRLRSPLPSHLISVELLLADKEENPYW